MSPLQLLKFSRVSGSARPCDSNKIEDEKAVVKTLLRYGAAAVADQQENTHSSRKSQAPAAAEERGKSGHAGVAREGQATPAGERAKLRQEAGPRQAEPPEARLKARRARPEGN